MYYSLSSGNDLMFWKVPPKDDSSLPKSPQGLIDNPFSFPFSKVEPTKVNGGSIKIVDSRTFKISQEISAAEVTVEPGAIR